MSAARPPVSIVVPAYNNAAFVAATIASILGQTFEDFELVVADHASSDETWDVLARYADDPRVRLLRTPAGGGAARNWNRVTGEARGEFVKLVCADDLLHPRCIAEQVRMLRTHPGVAMVASPRDVVDVSGRTLVRARGLAGLDGQVDGTLAIRRSVRSGGNIFGEPACVLFRREALDAAGTWSPDKEYLIDVDMYLRVLRQGDLYALPMVLAAFRVSSSQWSVTLMREQARQTVALGRQTAAEHSAVTTNDYRLGAVRAYTNAVMRRVAYTAWSSRIAPPVG